MFIVLNSYGQTVIKMTLPEQAETHIEGYTLFEDALPNNMPTAISIYGYDIRGGTIPYSYKWLKDNEVLSTEQSFILYPEIGKTYSLLISDKNNCNISIPIAIDQNKSSSSYGDNSTFDEINTYLTKEMLTVKFDEKAVSCLCISLYDMNGLSIFKNEIYSSTNIPVNLHPGVYFLYIRKDNEHKVMKYIIH